MDPASDASSVPVAALLAALERISAGRADRLLRLRGTLPDGDGFELLIFRGFTSSTTHPTDADPDRPPVAEGSRIETAELLAAPLDPLHPRPLRTVQDPARFLDAAIWDEGGEGSDRPPGR